MSLPIAVPFTNAVLIDNEGVCPYSSLAQALERGNQRLATRGLDRDSFLVVDLLNRSWLSRMKHAGQPFDPNSTPEPVTHIDGPYESDPVFPNG